MLVASNEIHERVRPDFMVGFNDGDFDWPFVIERLKKYGKLIEAWNAMSLYKDTFAQSKIDRAAGDAARKEARAARVTEISKWKCNTIKTKIEATLDIETRAMWFPGFMCIDARTAFRKQYPRKYSSLKFVLKEYGLTDKEDMSVADMFTAAAAATALKLAGADADPAAVAESRAMMRKIAHYCMIDSLGCQEIICKMNIIDDARGLAALASVTLYDALHLAGGMKVRAYAAKICRGKGIFMSSKPRAFPGSEQYPGAYVLHPKKGVIKCKETVREMAAKELKVDEEDLVKMEGWVLEHGATVDTRSPACPPLPQFSTPVARRVFDAFLKTVSKYPVSGLDFASLYPSIIMTYNLSPEMMVYSAARVAELEAVGHVMYEINFKYSGRTVQAWSIRHGSTDGQSELFGVFPSILLGLRNLRKAVKERMEHLDPSSGEWKYLKGKSC
jgi:DNA polymerase elongation subunit (family B)